MTDFIHKLLPSIEPSITKAVASFALDTGLEKLSGPDLTETLYRMISEHLPLAVRGLVPEQTLRDYIASTQERLIARINAEKAQLSQDNS